MFAPGAALGSAKRYFRPAVKLQFFSHCLLSDEQYASLLHDWPNQNRSGSMLILEKRTTPQNGRSNIFSALLVMPDKFRAEPACARLPKAPRS